MPDNVERKTTGKENFPTIKKQRELAKIGMAVSMGTLLATGFMGQKAGRAHICSGLALIGFSYWHYSLYQTKNR